MPTTFGSSGCYLDTSNIPDRVRSSIKDISHTGDAFGLRLIVRITLANGGKLEHGFDANYALVNSPIGQGLRLPDEKVAELCLIA